MILPTPAYTEKSSTYVNMEGRVLQSSRCYLPIGESKEEWKIFRSLSDFFENKLTFNNIQELRKEMCSEYEHLKYINNLPTQNSLNFGEQKIINKRILDLNIKNFYMTDSITRSSINMANCSKQILNLRS